MEAPPLRRVNPLIPVAPEPAKHAPTWIQEKPLSVWSELQGWVLLTPTMAAGL